MKDSLRNLGLQIHVGHKPGFACPQKKLRLLTVLHTNGIHQFDVHYCECDAAAEHWIQLIRQQWYPATPIDPETCATFEVMRDFHVKNLQGNITAYDYYRSLEMLTDGWQRTKLPVSLSPNASIAATQTDDPGS